MSLIPKNTLFVRKGAKKGPHMIEFIITGEKKFVVDWYIAKDVQ